jgi:hypothetical protein
VPFFKVSTKNKSIMPSSSTNDKKTARILPEEFAPGPDQVIIGRGKRCATHEGNLRFRNIVKAELKNYMSTCNKVEKSIILLRVMRQVQRSNKHKIGFVKQDINTGRWMELSDFASRVAVAQAFRDANSGRGYRSSKQSKQNKRRTERLNSLLRHSMHQAMTLNNPVFATWSIVPNMSPPRPLAAASLHITPSPSLEAISSACNLLQQEQNRRGMCAANAMVMSMVPNFGPSQQRVDPYTMQPHLPMKQHQMSGYMIAATPSMGSVPPCSPTVKPTDELLQLEESFAGPPQAAYEEAMENDDDSFLDVFHSISLRNLKAALTA